MNYLKILYLNQTFSEKADQVSGIFQTRHGQFHMYSMRDSGFLNNKIKFISLFFCKEYRGQARPNINVIIANEKALS
jgi:hypothetical protein